MLLNPIIAMLHDTTNDRWHPIVFREAPLPGEAGPTRHKSKSHHTEGFPTREEAITGCHELQGELGKHSIGEVKLCLEKAFEWDGEGVPAMVVFFGEEAGEVVPLLM